MSTQARQGTIRPHAGSNPMKWTITNVMYACFACLLLTGLLHECHLQWMGNAFAVATGSLACLALLKYLNGDQLQ